MELRSNLSKLIETSEIDIELIEERECKNMKEFGEKVKNQNYFSFYLEIYLISKLINIIISI